MSRIITSFVVALVMMSAIAAAAPPASATVFTEAIHPPLLAAPEHGRTSAVCSFVKSVHASPGVALTSGSGTTSTGGETGSFTCVGTLNGYRVTGLGSIGFEGSYTGNLVSAQLYGRYSVTVPTDAGPMHFSDTFTESDIGLAAQMQLNASQLGARLTGTEFYAPTQGNGITTPATEAVTVAILIATDQK